MPKTPRKDRGGSVIVLKVELSGTADEADSTARCCIAVLRC